MIIPQFYDWWNWSCIYFDILIEITKNHFNSFKFRRSKHQFYNSIIKLINFIKFGMNDIVYSIISFQINLKEFIISDHLEVQISCGLIHFINWDEIQSFRDSSKLFNLSFIKWKEDMRLILFKLFIQHKLFYQCDGDFIFIKN